MNLFRSALLAPLGFLFAQPAFAWWEYAKWGLTEQQLVAASKSAAKPCTSSIDLCKPAFRDYAPTLYAEPTVAGLPAVAHFAFDTQSRLAATYIIFRGANYSKLVEAIVGVYGQPVAIIGDWPERRTWRDTTKGTIITLWHFPDSYKDVIVYKPIAKGL